MMKKAITDYPFEKYINQVFEDLLYLFDTDQCLDFLNVHLSTIKIHHNYKWGGSARDGEGIIIGLKIELFDERLTLFYIMEGKCFHFSESNSYSIYGGTCMYNKATIKTIYNLAKYLRDIMPVVYKHTENLYREINDKDITWKN